MLLQYYGLQRDPFGTTPDPRCLFPSRTHREAAASMEYGFLNNRGFTAIIAPPGTGKTTLVFRFLEKFRELARSAFLFDIDSQCEPREFVGRILRDLGIPPAQSSSEMREQLNGALVAEHQAGRKFVIVIDEAQNLSETVLETVRLLTNFETSTDKLMHIVLSGQPQLADKLMQASLVQLRQRISTICRIEPLSIEETIAYIHYRLEQAGYHGEPLFAADALKLIAEASRGIPRTINNLCFNALSLCCALKSKQVDDGMVSEVISDLRLIPQSGEPIASVADIAAERPYEGERQKQTKRPQRFLISAASALLLMCILGILGYTELRVPQSPTTTKDDSSSNPKVLPASVPSPAATDTGKTVVTEPAPNSAPFAITVEPFQKLQNLSEQYLGGFDPGRLHQIQALNPKLTDPDHIEIGQKIWLPGPPVVSVATNTTPPASTRNLP